jgi:hypothetical protein
VCCSCWRVLLSETIIVICSYECKYPVNPITNLSRVTICSLHVKEASYQRKLRIAGTNYGRHAVGSNRRYKPEVMDPLKCSPLCPIVIVLLL